MIKSKNSETVAINSSAKALGIKTSKDAWQEFAEEVDASDIKLPFLFSDAVLILDKSPVVHNLLFVGNKEKLVHDLVLQDDTQIYIMLDQGLVGEDAIYVVRHASGPSDIQRWMSQMNNVSLIIKESFGKLFVACPLKAFKK